MNKPRVKEYDYKSFEKKEILGCGSYGRVELLYHEKLKLVVGKFFTSTGDPQKIKRDQANAKKEAQILDRIQHENIVRFHGFLTNSNCFVIILEYIPCGNLENLLHNDPEMPLPWKIRARFFVELANALNYLHYGSRKQSYVHGDIKPQNILLTETLQIKLADFGAAAVAKRSGSITGTVSLSINSDENTQCTPLYTAPEYLADPKKDRKRSMDVYSFGMVGYEILTRKAIFSGCNVPFGTLLEMIKATGQKPCHDYLDQEASSLRKSSPTDLTILAKLRKIVEQCSEHKAEDRPKIRAVKKNLDQFAQKQEINHKTTKAKAQSLVDQRKLLPNSLTKIDSRHEPEESFDSASGAVGRLDNEPSTSNIIQSSSRNEISLQTPEEIPCRSQSPTTQCLMENTSFLRQTLGRLDDTLRLITETNRRSWRIIAGFMILFLIMISFLIYEVFVLKKQHVGRGLLYHIISWLIGAGMAA